MKEYTIKADLLQAMLNVLQELPYSRVAAVLNQVAVVLEQQKELPVVNKTVDR